MKRLLCLLALASCADPAVLEVRMKIEARDLDDIELVVGKGDFVASETFIDCTLPLGAEPTGTCGFEGAEGRWTDESEMTFVLYGEPDTPLAIFADGNRRERSVTATAAEAALPPTAGERRILDLTLFSRTAERRRCSFELPRGPGAGSANANALAVYNVFTDPFREMIVSSGGSVSIVRPVPDGDSCVTHIPLTGIPQCSNMARMATFCDVRPGGMVVGPFRADTLRVQVGAVCETPAQIGWATSTGRCSEPRFTPIPFGGTPDDVSDPVIVDFDGNGDFEVVFTVLDRRNNPTGAAPVYLAVGHAERITTRLEPFDLEPLAMNSVRPHTPLVHQLADNRLIVIPGSSPAFGVWRDAFGPIVGPAEVELARAPALVASTGLQGVVRVTTAGNVELLVLDPRGTTVARSYALLEPITADPSVPVAIGRLTEGGPVSAIVVDDGRMQSFALEGEEASAVRGLWDPGAVSGAQFALLANIDGVSGADVVSFAPLSARLEAATAAGAKLEGWPIDLTRQTGRTHVVVTDLDGPDVSSDRVLRDLEIVTLSEGLLEIITLGPGSYDIAQTPWPAIRHDPLNSSRYAAEADPHQINFRAAVR